MTIDQFQFVGVSPLKGSVTVRLRSGGREALSFSLNLQQSGLEKKKLFLSRGVSVETQITPSVCCV